MTDISTTARSRPPSCRVRLADIALAAFLVYGAAAQDAHAYVDPGSGGALITAILGFLGAVAYTTRKYWYRLKGGLRRRGPPPR